MKTAWLKGPGVSFLFALVISVVAGLVFYKPFYFSLNTFLEPISGFSGFYTPPNIRLQVAVFDFSYTFFLAFFLSFFFDWRETLRYWAYGYLLLIGLSIFAAGIYIPTPFRLLFILVSASAGFLVGRGIRYVYLTALKPKK